MCDLDKEVDVRVGCLVCISEVRSQGADCDLRDGQCQDGAVPQVHGPRCQSAVKYRK